MHFTKSFFSIIYYSISIIIYLTYIQYIYIFINCTLKFTIITILIVNFNDKEFYHFFLSKRFKNLYITSLFHIYIIIDLVYFKVKKI